VAILELKKWGALRGQKKVSGQYKYLTCMVIFRCYEDSVAMIYLIKPNIGL